ncbi:MAG: NUDIX hydrolase [Microbacteriaceae bacterium]
MTGTNQARGAAAADITRLTSRVLLFDRDGRILLFLTKAPDTSGVARWITPGGGVDPGETHAQAATRELFEETGLSGIDLGESVWSTDFTVQWDDADHGRGHAEFYRATVDTFTPSDAHWTAEERVDVLEWRWWTPAEVAAATETIEPAELPELVRIHHPH